VNVIVNININIKEDIDMNISLMANSDLIIGLVDQFEYCGIRFKKSDEKAVYFTCEHEETDTDLEVKITFDGEVYERAAYCKVCFYVGEFESYVPNVYTNINVNTNMNVNVSV
jgi:hypothetical protein